MIKIDPNNITKGNVVGLLNIPDDFDDLVINTGISNLPNKNSVNDETVYEFKFNVNLKQALANDLLTVKVEAFEIDQSVTQTQQSIIDIILKNNNTIKNTIKNNVLLSSTIVDLTSKVNNASTNSQRPDALLKQRKSLVVKNNQELIENNRDLPIIESSIFSTSDNLVSNRTSKESAYELLKSGFDPANVTKQTSRISSNESFKGLTIHNPVSHKRDDRYRERYLLLARDQLILGNSTFDFGIDTNLPVIDHVITQRIDFTGKLSFNSQTLVNKFVVRFSLMNSKNVPVDSTIGYVDHAENVRLFNVPLIPPKISVSRNKTVGLSKVTLRQLDPRATSIELYKKIIRRSTRQDRSPYVLVTSVDASNKDGDIVVDVQVDSTSPIVFRAIALGLLGERSHSFNSVVLSSTSITNYQRNSGFNSTSLIASINQNGVILELRNIPCNVISFEIQRRNATLKQKNFSSITNNLNIILDENNLQPIVVIDSNVKPRNIYEYRCLFVDKYSSRIYGSSNAIIEYVPFTDNVVSTEIVNLLVTPLANNEINVTFELITSFIESGLQTIKNLLDLNDLSDFFEDNILEEKELLNDLIAHQIVRFNLTTGESESFGVYSGESFSDAELRKINGVKPLKKGNTYRYEVYALLRSPFTLFEKLQQLIEESGKEYTFKPSKYLHPLIFQTGNITSKASRERNHAKDEMTFGRVGNISTVNVSLGDDTIAISDFSIMKHSQKRISLKWKTSVENRFYDHFLVMREILGIRSFLGAVHSSMTTNVYEMLYELQDEDIGSVRFILIPVLSDYSLDQEVISEVLLVN